MDNFNKLPIGLEGFGSMDDFDLAMLGLLTPQEEEEPEEDKEPTISPFHDIDSVEFHLWMEEEVDKESARRLAMKKPAKAPVEDPKTK